jgi:pilus biogenesis lipoprotein CpaD
MKQISAALLFTTLSLLISACDSLPDRTFTYATWKQFPVIPEPTATATPVRLDVQFQPGSEVMTPENEVALSNFLAQSRISNGAAVDLSVPLPRADETQLVSGRISAVERTLARRGIVVTSVFASQSGAPDSVAVLGNSTTVHLPPCPGYTAPTQLDSEKQGVSNMGCSNTANLDMMVANPTDIAQGRPLPPADAEAATAGLQRYRDGKIIPPVSVDTQSQ